MSQSQIFDLGLLHRNAITRFQRSEYLSMQSENALHLPIGSDLSRRFHETNLHVSFIGGNPSNYWFVVDRHRSTLKRRSLRFAISGTIEKSNEAEEEVYETINISKIKAQTPNLRVCFLFSCLCSTSSPNDESV